MQIASNTIQSQSQVKCLRYWWQHDLSPNKSVEDNIAKARRAFFATGTFLNPLSGQSIFEIFVIRVLLYGCETSETWILTPTIMTKLEKFRSLDSLPKQASCRPSPPDQSSSTLNEGLHSHQEAELPCKAFVKH